MKKTKALGQHFLASRAVLKKILAVISPLKDELVVEIGAGKGALTFPLAELGAKVIAIEKDAILVPFLLREKKRNVKVVEEDVLKLDFKVLLENEKGLAEKAILVGNLPYSISSPLLFKILETKELFSRCVFLLQREVAERLSAQPGTKKYSPLSILFQLNFAVRLHFLVAPGSFSPPPRVQSALVSLSRRKNPLFPVNNRDFFRKVLRAAFARRRKTLFNNLKSLAIPPSRIAEAMDRLSLNLDVRAEDVAMEKLVGLSDLLSPHVSRF